ncbi:MAG: feruloyl-CoA synthase [Burkholderiales bacterium]
MRTDPPAADPRDVPHAVPRAVERDPAVLFAPPRVERVARADGCVLLRSPDPLGASARSVGEWLEAWAARAPDRTFLAERDPAGAWRTVGYADALARVRALGTWLLERGLGPERPLAILSDNGVDHALLSLAAMHVGVPAASVAVAYSLMSADHAKLRAIVSTLTPGALFVSAAAPFAAALRAIAPLHDATVVAADPTGGPDGVVPLERLLERTDEAAVACAFAAVGPDTVAKVLFTSGSTGTPKGVVNTQRMLCSNQQAKAQVWPFLERTPPVIVDWLPWSHTFGANHNFNLVLRNGGTLYVDAGKAAPGPFDRTLANLREVSPTVYFNVPRGYDLLVPALRADAALRRTFFARLQVVFYAAAALPQHLWDALIELSVAELGRPVPMVSAWGSTETAPLSTDCHFQASRAGVIGLPVPGTELKLVPAAGKLEIRVRGANVTPGYWRAPEATAAAFDDEGFYRIGDAVRFADAEHPERGLVFDGRIAEDFKLSSGTWVSVGGLRVKGIEALAPLAQDVVVAGHDRDAVGFLVVPNAPACRALAGLPADAPLADALGAAAVRNALRDGLRRLHAASGGAGSMHATRALLLDEPPSIDAGEITDKGYLNQRAILARRAAQVDRLYAARPDDRVATL